MDEDGDNNQNDHYASLRQRLTRRYLPKQICSTLTINKLIEQVPEMQVSLVEIPTYSIPPENQRPNLYQEPRQGQPRLRRYHGGNCDGYYGDGFDDYYYCNDYYDDDDEHVMELNAVVRAQKLSNHSRAPTSCTKLTKKSPTITDERPRYPP
ncbi:hypothetical protein BGZ79_010951 [Entomortierella chlamydospora]|nr:hypothetical protein BGZ79_010951 [Entomortierella chlamydospora]